MSDRATQEQLQQALSTVQDPEIRRPITELGMVESAEIGADGRAAITVLLTVAGCPMKDTLTRDVQAAVAPLPGVAGVDVHLGVMSDEQRRGLQEQLRGSTQQRENRFARPESLTRVLAIASGKGGVGKSSITTNLACAMAASGMKVGVVDADVYGHSLPAMFGVADERPTQVEDMIMPVPTHDLKLISIGMLKKQPRQVVAWRGPMLDRALVQMLTDVFWGDLDVLLLDMPPGTGDMPISVGQHLKNSDVVVVTTPQDSAAEVAERAGTLASMLHQRVAGVVENMSWLAVPGGGAGDRMEIFGSGGGERVAQTLSERFGYDVPLLGQVPLDPSLREGSDRGSPVVIAEPESAAGRTLTDIAKGLSGRSRGLAGKSLGLSPV